MLKRSLYRDSKKKSKSRNNIYLKPNNIQQPARYIRISQKNILRDDNTFFEKNFFILTFETKNTFGSCEDRNACDDNNNDHDDNNANDGCASFICKIKIKSIIKFFI